MYGAAGVALTASLARMQAGDYESSLTGGARLPTMKRNRVLVGRELTGQGELSLHDAVVAALTNGIRTRNVLYFFQSDTTVVIWLSSRCQWWMNPP